MVLDLALVTDEKAIAFKGFKSPKDSDEISFSTITYENKDLVVSAEVEACSDVEEFMDCLNIRVVLDDQYAAEALREVEKAAFILFESLANDNKTLEKRALFYEDLLKIKLKGKKKGWAFTCNDRTFTPLKSTKVDVGVKMEVVFTPGFYYTKTHCGLYLTLKSLNFPKVIKALKR
jgi:hypothetical protein